MKTYKKDKIAIIGLGYVGINLCVQFGKHFDTFGYDINLKRVKELSKKILRSRTSHPQLKSQTGVSDESCLGLSPCHTHPSRCAPRSFPF